MVTATETTTNEPREGYERGQIGALGDLGSAFMLGFPKSLELPMPQVRWQPTRDENHDIGVGHDSPNQRDAQIAIQAIVASAWGTPKQWEEERAKVARLCEMHREALWTSEQCTGRPHGGIYLDASMGQRIAAFHKADTELLRMLDRRLSDEVSSMLVASTPQLEVWCCMERGPAGPAAQQQAGFLRQLKGRPHEGELAPGAPWKANIETDSWVCIKLLMALQAKGDQLAGAASIQLDDIRELPKMARKIEIYRWGSDGRGKGSGHLARYVGKPPKGFADVCDWVMVDHAAADGGGERGSEDIMRGIRFGVGFTKPAPMNEVPAGAKVYRTAA